MPARRRCCEANQSTAGRAPLGVLAIFVLFVFAVAYLVGASFVRRTVPTFALTPAQPQLRTNGTARSDTVTVDARDPHRWRFFDFDRGSVIVPPDTVGWDLGFRRFHVIASAGILDMGKLPFDSLLRAPVDGYAANSLGTDTLNPAIKRWYAYDFLSHLLESREHTYVVRTLEGRYAKITILSYYCPGLTAGCVTLRYLYPLRLATTHRAAPP